MLKSMTTFGLALVATCGLCVMTTAAQAQEAHDDHDHMEPTEGVVVLKATKGNKVRGRLMLKQMDAGVKVTGRISGLTPGEHGFHIHEFGDMTAPDGTSAGGHFNPDGHPHGGPDSKERHAGDLGNITADSEGIAKIEGMAPGLKLHYIIGRAFVVHGGKDDLKSQPSGDAGPRVAVGVVGIAGPKMKKEKKQ